MSWSYPAVVSIQSTFWLGKSKCRHSQGENVRLAVYFVYLLRIFPPKMLVPVPGSSHDEKCFALLHQVVSVPVSEITLSAVISLIPGILVRSTLSCEEAHCAHQMQGTAWLFVFGRRKRTYPLPNSPWSLWPVHSHWIKAACHGHFSASFKPIPTVLTCTGWACGLPFHIFSNSVSPIPVR